MATTTTTPHQTTSFFEEFTGASKEQWLNKMEESKEIRRLKSHMKAERSHLMGGSEMKFSQLSTEQRMWLTQQGFTVMLKYERGYSRPYGGGPTAGDDVSPKSTYIVSWPGSYDVFCEIVDKQNNVATQT